LIVYPSLLPKLIVPSSKLGTVTSKVLPDKYKGEMPVLVVNPHISNLTSENTSFNDCRDVAWHLIRMEQPNDWKDGNTNLVKHFGETIPMRDFSSSSKLATEQIILSNPRELEGNFWNSNPFNRKSFLLLLLLLLSHHIMFFQTITGWKRCDQCQSG
jgi:hypothetical protein